MLAEQRSRATQIPGRLTHDERSARQRDRPNLRVCAFFPEAALAEMWVYEDLIDREQRAAQDLGAPRLCPYVPLRPLQEPRVEVAVELVNQLAIEGRTGRRPFGVGKPVGIAEHVSQPLEPLTAGDDVDVAIGARIDAVGEAGRGFACAHRLLPGKFVPGQRGVASVCAA